MALQVDEAGTIISEGHCVKTGLVLSFTITLNEHVAIFPDPSVAVYVTTVVPSENVLPLLMLGVKEIKVQLSIAMGTAHVTIALQEVLAKTIMSVGQAVRVGLILSFTITLNEHVDKFPDPSIALYVTTVVPTLNVEPGLRFDEIVTASQSVATGATQFTTDEQATATATVTSEQPAKTGGALSMTTTLNTQLVILLLLSIALYLTSVVPNGKESPGL
jgi:hypothetical protein